MYRIKRPIDPSQRQSAIIQLNSIRRSCHLFPQFPKGKVADTDAKHWTSTNVLELYPAFHINNFIDLHAYQTIY